ncbi:NADPH-dependent F420 reductase [Micromonospora sp. NPDC000089]|uniref:NADPH-dependent F420 reductase n=1 Tax=unclassified Micromonospora TaxID=2617518 RepID=UPI0036A91887
MKIAVLGTGVVGRTLAGRLTELGHQVTIGTRDVAATLARTEPDGMGNPPYRQWAAERPEITLATFADATADAELIVNASSGAASVDVLTAAGAANLAGKVLLDTANPLDFSRGFPPSLFVSDTDSLAERIQAAFPELRVVKALNTLAAELMVHPAAVAGGEHTVFVAGNDADAKATVTRLLESFGHTDVIDLGDVTGARGTEMLLPIWLRLMGTLDTSMFQFRIVR